MKVILLEELRGKGGEGDVVEVSRGFANNYLLKKGIAVKATEGNLKQLELRRKNIAKREEVRIANAESLKAQLEGATFTIKAKVGDEGILFGSVTPQMISDAIKEQKEAEAADEAAKAEVEAKVAAAKAALKEASDKLQAVAADASAELKEFASAGFKSLLAGWEEAKKTFNQERK